MELRIDHGAVDRARRLAGAIVDPSRTGDDPGTVRDDAGTDRDEHRAARDDTRTVSGAEASHATCAELRGSLEAERAEPLSELQGFAFSRSVPVNDAGGLYR